MGEDLSQGAKIGVTLIILCALIAIVFSIMSIMKNITTQGAEDLQHSISSMMLQKFDDFDQREVTGAQVLSACKLFQDQPVTIVVYTNRKDVGTNGPDIYGLQDCTWLERQLDPTTNKEVFRELGTIAGNGTTVYDTTTSTFTLADGVGCAYAKYPTTSYVYNNDRTKMNDRTDVSYVSNSAKYHSYLIKTSSGDIMGIVFDEV